MATKSTLLTALATLLMLPVFAQDEITTYINEALGFVEQKEYQQAKLSLMDAINQIDNMMATQVADALPDEINGLKSDGEETTGTGAMGMVGGGMSIVKTYQHPAQEANNAEVTIIANAPMLNAMNLYLTNPGMLGPGYKSVRVGTRRAVMKTETEDYYDSSGNSKQIRWSEIQIPLSQTLITVNARGFASEQDELAFVGKLEIEKIKEMLGE